MSAGSFLGDHAPGASMVLASGGIEESRLRLPELESEGR